MEEREMSEAVRLQADMARILILCDHDEGRVDRAWKEIQRRNREAGLSPADATRSVYNDLAAGGSK